MQWLVRPLITPPTGVRIPLEPGVIIRCKILALYIRDCVSLCLSDETLKAVGPLYLVSSSSSFLLCRAAFDATLSHTMSMPGGVKYPTSLHWKCVTCRGLHLLA